MLKLYGQLFNKELVNYEKTINDWLAWFELDEEKERGLMTYFHRDEGVNAAVRSIKMSIETFRNVPCMVATCETTRELTQGEVKTLKSFLFGQMSDGWGESVEQRSIPVSNDKHIKLSPPLEFYTEEEWKTDVEDEEDS